LIVNINPKGIDNLKNKIDLFTHSHIPRLIATTIYSDIKEKFIKEEDVNSKRFAPLKPRTIKTKKKQGKIPYKILRDTGQLLNSLNTSITGNNIKIGYSVPYATFHQHGTKYMAQRKILPTEESEIPIGEINDIIVEYFKGL
jgi:phage virion morphogenesis protein